MSEEELIEVNRNYAETITRIVDEYDANDIDSEAALLKLLGTVAFLGVSIHDKMVRYFTDKQAKESKK